MLVRWKAQGVSGAINWESGSFYGKPLPVTSLLTDIFCDCSTAFSSLLWEDLWARWVRRVRLNIRSFMVRWVLCCILMDKHHNRDNISGWKRTKLLNWFPLHWKLNQIQRHAFEVAYIGEEKSWMDDQNPATSPGISDSKMKISLLRNISQILPYILKTSYLVHNKPGYEHASQSHLHFTVQCFCFISGGHFKRLTKSLLLRSSCPSFFIFIK